MSPWVTVIPIVSGGLALLVLALWFVRLRLRQAIASARGDLDAILVGKPALRVDDRASFLGLASVGAVQLRGLAVLALAHGELVSLQIVPRRTIRIPLDDIILVAEVGSWLGKTVFEPLLQIAWRVPGGEECAAWRVRDLAGWKAAIEGARSAHATSVAGTV